MSRVVGAAAVRKLGRSMAKTSEGAAGRPLLTMMEEPAFIALIVMLMSY